MSITRLDTAASAAASTLAYSVSAGSDRLLVVQVHNEWDPESVDDDVTAVDYGGQAMVKVRFEAGVEVGHTIGSSTWYLLDAEIALAVGTTITPTFSNPGNVSDPMVHAASYEGARQDAQVVVEHKGDAVIGASPDPITTIDLIESSGNLLVAGGAIGEPLPEGTVSSWSAAMTEQTDQLSTSAASSYADRLATTEDNQDIELNWVGPVNRQSINSVHFAQVGFSPSCLREASATANATSSATAYELIPGMTLTPGGGDFLAWFSASVNADVGLPESIFVAIFVNGVIVAHTEREIHFDSSLDGGAIFLSAATHALVQPTDGQVVDIRWRVTSGATTMTVRHRTLNLIKLDAADVDEATATADDTTTSASYVQMDSMTLTPGAGKFALFFTCSAEANAPGALVEAAVFVNGVLVAHTNRQLFMESSIDPNEECIAIACEVNPGASEVVEIRWKTSGGTATVHERTLTLWETEQIQEVSSSADTTTTSPTFVLLDSMTLTPVADEYLVIFSSSWESTSLNASFLEGIIEEAGVEVPHSERRSGSDNSTEDTAYPVASNGIVNVDGAELVEFHVRRSVSGTMTIHERTMILISCLAVVEKVAEDDLDLEIDPEVAEVTVALTAQDLLDLGIDEATALLLGLIQPEDTTGLSQDEIAQILADAERLDDIDIDLAEDAQVQAGLTAEDDLDLEILEGPGLVTVAIEVSDILDLEINEDVANLLGLIAPVDLTGLTVDEVAEVLAAADRLDTLDLSLGEVVELLGILDRDDLLDLDLDEDAQVAVIILATDTLDLEINEDPGVVVIVGAVEKVAFDDLDLEINEDPAEVSVGITDDDTLDLSVIEVAPTDLLGLIEPEDTTGASVDELAEILARAERLDTLDIDLGEAADLLALLVRFDDLDLEIQEDAGQVVVGITDDDTLDLDITEGPGLVAVGIQVDDTLNLALIEPTDLLAFLERADTLNLALVEGVPLVFVSLSRDDLLDIALDEQSNVVISEQIDIVAADTLDLAIVEAVGQVVVAIQATDLLDLSIAEVAQVVGFLNRQDILDLDLDDQAQVVVFIQAADQLDIEILDASDLVIPIQVADTLDIDLAEFSQVFNAISVLDTLNLELSDEDAFIQTFQPDFEGIITKTITLQTLLECRIKMVMTRSVRFTLEIDPGVQRNDD